MFSLSSSSSPSKSPQASTRHVLITVSIVDGNAAFRNSLAQNLARFPGIVIFDKCDSAANAARALSERPPRVLFVGDSLTDSGNWDFIESLRHPRATTQVIALSDSAEVAEVQAAFRCGAVGYLLRSTPLPFIHQALYDVTTGGSPLAPTVARALVASFCAPPPAPIGLLADLTSREAEVLDLLSRGMRYRQIASEMKLSADTVHSHAKNVYRKLKVSSKTEAAMIWLRSLSDSPTSATSKNFPVAAVA